jgi:hypothetical protein
VAHRAPRSGSWEHDLDRKASQTIRASESLLRLVRDADAAKGLTPQQWKRLVDSCREAQKKLAATVEEIGRKRLPFEDVVDCGAELSPTTDEPTA